MMNPEIKEKWIKALRSGKFVQGTEYLHQDNKYCCLGVICEVEFNPSWKQHWAGSGEEVYTFKEMASRLDEETLRHIGISVDEQRLLIKLNDELYYSFDGIATWIETHL